MSEPDLASPSGHTIAEFRQGYEEKHRLRGYRSTSCGFVTATWGLVCPNCHRPDLSEVDLSGEGTIEAFTVQHVPSDEFLNDVPYAYVVVALKEGGRVTGWVEKVEDDHALGIGETVHWVESYKPGVHFARGPAGASSNSR
jgi:uncharacterized OB-fold protein